MNVWDESPVCEVDDLRQKATAAGEKIHIAEVMEIGSIKLDELGPSLSQHKGRLVFRGDATKDQDGLPAKFRELVFKLSLWFCFRDCYTQVVVLIADAKEAYLQALLRTAIPNLGHLTIFLLASGMGTEMPPTSGPPLYGHPEAGDDGFRHLSEILTAKMGFKSVECVPSLWWNETIRVLVAAYVDDIIAAGPQHEVDEFWKVDGVSITGRYLGRDHLISSDKAGKDLFLSMREYCPSAVDMYLHIVGDKPLKKVATAYLDSELIANDWEITGNLGERSASILVVT